MDREASMKRDARKPKTALASFASAQTGQRNSGMSEGAEPERQRGKHRVVGINIRFTRDQWERVHQLALAEGVSIQRLVIRGLSQVFHEKGLRTL
jgi:hypothetical protein